MSRLSVRILPARRRNHALSLAPEAVSNLDFAVRSGQSGLRCLSRPTCAAAPGREPRPDALGIGRPRPRGPQHRLDRPTHVHGSPLTGTALSWPRALATSPLTATSERDRALHARPQGVRTRARQDARRVPQPSSRPPDCAEPARIVEARPSDRALRVESTTLARRMALRVESTTLARRIAPPRPTADRPRRLGLLRQTAPQGSLRRTGPA